MISQDWKTITQLCRDIVVNNLGLRVLRLKNEEVGDIEKVLEKIMKYL